MKNIFFFDSFVTPKIITFIYWLLLLGVVLGGLVSIFKNFSFMSLIVGLLTIVLGAVFARMWCEIMIVFFSINDNIKKLVDKQ